MAKFSTGDLGLLLVYGLCRVLPMRWVSAFGAWRGRYRGDTRAELEARVCQNLTEIAPELAPEAVSEVLTALRRESGRAALEVLISDRIVKAKRIRWLEHPGLNVALEQNRSVVFALVHVCNLGDVLGGDILDRFDHFRTREVVVRTIQSPVMRWIVKRCRARLLRDLPGLIQAPHAGQARRALTELQNPPAMLMLHVDEARGRQVAFPMFGASEGDGRVRDAKGTNAAYAVRFARKASAYLVPVVMQRSDSDPLSFEARVLEAWDMACEAKSDDQVLAQMSGAFEAIILQNPAQWLNLYHRRPTPQQNLSS